MSTKVKNIIVEIRVSKRAKIIYKKIFGNDISDRFVISESRIEHISSHRPEILFADIVYCINNPSFVTQVKEYEQYNIVSKLPSGKYMYILVDVRTNKLVNKRYCKNGILSARYLDEDKKIKETKRNVLVYPNID